MEQQEGVREVPGEDWPNAFRLGHLQGGMRASNQPGAEVEFFPRLGSTPEGRRISAYGDFHGLLAKSGLKFIGIEFVTNQQQSGGLEPTMWRPHYWNDGGDLANDAETLWSQLATAGHDEDDFQLLDLCRRIAFQIQAGRWRLHDLSEAYHRELCGQVAEGDFQDGQKFETLNSFFLYLALHSVFSELATLRDYLGEFVAKYVLADFQAGKTHVRSMTGLRKHVLPGAIGNHPLADHLQKITGKGGWLRELSAYRDLAVHYTPLVSAERRGFLETRIVTVKDRAQFPTIYFALPTDPQSVKKTRSSGVAFEGVQAWLEASISALAETTGGPDALVYSHSCLGKMVGLAKMVGSFAPVQPKTPHLGPGDMIGPVTVLTG